MLGRPCRRFSTVTKWACSFVSRDSITSRRGASACRIRGGGDVAPQSCPQEALLVVPPGRLRSLLFLHLWNPASRSICVAAGGQSLDSGFRLCSTVRSEQRTLASICVPTRVGDRCSIRLT